MSCEDLELLMADALGGELSEADRLVFEDHIAACARCRDEYESARAAVAMMKTLPGPTHVTVRREGDRLVIGSGSRRSMPWGGGLLRYAAGLLIAFSAGYGLNAGLLLYDAVRGSVTVSPRDPAEDGPGSEGSLEGALIRAHARRPLRSGLAKCLIAMSSAR